MHECICKTKNCIYRLITYIFTWQYIMGSLYFSKNSSIIEILMGAVHLPIIYLISPPVLVIQFVITIINNAKLNILLQKKIYT